MRIMFPDRLPSSDCLNVMTVVFQHADSAENFTEGLTRGRLPRPHFAEHKMGYDCLGTLVHVLRRDRAGKEQEFERIDAEVDLDMRIWLDWANLPGIALELTFVTLTTLFLVPKDEKMHAVPHHEQQPGREGNWQALPLLHCRPS